MNSAILNTSFEVGVEEGLDIVEEFYSDESKPEQHQQAHDFTHEDFPLISGMLTAVSAGFKLKIKASNDAYFYLRNYSAICTTTLPFARPVFTY